MTIVQMLQQSGLLTLLGMGVVFTFLIIMILCMYLLHTILHALKLDEEEKKEATSSSNVTVSATVANQDAAIAAIAASAHEQNK